MKNFLCIMLLLLTSLSVVHGQGKAVVSGTIKGPDSEPLIGVTVVYKGTTTGTTSDMNGAFRLPVPDANGTLVFSYIGYATQEVPIQGKEQLDVTLQTDDKRLSEVVVTGYSSEKRADLTGAVAVVDMDNIKDNPAPNVMQSLQGQVPGLYVATDGSPNPNTEVRIRGTSTLGNNNPLYIIDGVPSTTGMQYLNPNDIESVQVLKDGSSASIYGARASNGVIIVTTKKAKAGELSINYNANVAVEQFRSRLDMLDTNQRGEALWRAAVNDNRDPDNPQYTYTWHRDNAGNPVLDDVQVTEWLDEAMGIRAGNTDWFDEILGTGVNHTHDLAISQGSEKGGFRFSVNYFDNKGILKGSNYNRITTRLNSNYTLFNGKVTVGENLSISKARETPMPSGIGGTPLMLGVRSLPILPVYTEDGQFAGPTAGGFSDRDNPVAVIEDNKLDKRHTAKVFGNVYANLEIVKNLNFRTNFGVDYESVYFRNVTKAYQRGFLSNPVNSLYQSQGHLLSWTWNNVLSYQLEKGDHSATFMAGTEAVESSFLDFSAYREQFALENDDYLYLDAGTGNKNNSGGGTGFSLLSYFGKASYAFQEKYLASATLRYDGSSRFGQENRFGLFPAFSLGWRLSNEDFIMNNLSFVSDLKLRAGWGKTGNQSIADYATYALYRANYGDDQTWAPSNATAYDIGGNDSGTLPSGYYATQTANNRLRWESTAETNVGLDFGFLSQKIFGSMEYFVRNTDDILIQPAFIGVIGDGGSRWINGASMRNKGFEFVLGYRNSIGTDFSYDVSANLGSFRDKITDLPEEVLRSYPGNIEKNILGHSVRSFFGYVADGIFQNEEEVQGHAEQPGKGVGRLRFKDLNGDGVINTLDQDYIGVANPSFEYGLNTNMYYKNFDLSFFFQGISGMEVNTQSFQIYSDFTSIWNGENSGVRTLDAWTPQNTSSTIPALALADNNDERRLSTYYINNGSYLKLRHLQLGYKIPQNVLEPIFVKNLRVYLRGENLLTIKDNKGDDKFVGPDPETPNDQYPRPTRLTFGLNVTF
ncbi:TonB-dependent receptor [Pontibacter sp. E15-1]|uniref:SusC/RagA family TonB-linked outer membrane protein n=1 Tax=Pontibacter sp. E15-1 TaxID=2919918 RepID=UPI001F50289F|nr:TonB-dependent receptor [Pontibacter sp. E15-1]MCJ8167305.1 TonB-dependent receptor [Pontibacter sp. E15-1]